MTYVDEGPGPWPSLPFLRPGNTLRVKPIYSLRPDGVYIIQGGEALKMASPLMPDPDRPGVVWIWVDGAWTPAGVSGRASDTLCDGLAAAGAVLGREAFRSGRSPVPASAFLWSFVNDGVMVHFS